jgi:allophanate hydrolase subunit 1
LPPITFRYSGESHLLLELEMNTLGIKNRLLIQEILVFLRKKEEVLELIPGVTSLLIKYKDPIKENASSLVGIPQNLIKNILENCYNSGLLSKDIKFPIRRIKLPLAYRDQTSLQAIERYS